MKNKSMMIGILGIWGWCFFSALSRVLTSHVTQQIDPAVICFYTFLFSSVFFTSLNAKNYHVTLRKLTSQENRRNIYWLNVTTFGAWFFLIYPLKYIEPAMVSIITLGLSPVATLIFSCFKKNKTKLNLFDIVISLLMLTIVLYIVSLCLKGVTTIGDVALVKIIYSIISCFIVGFATTAGYIYAKRLSKNQLTPIEVLASRFYLTMLLSAIIALVMGKNLLISYLDIKNIALLASCLVILPLYLGQIGIKELEPITVAMTTPLMPVMVIAFEIVDHQHFSIGTIIATVMTCLLVLCSAYVHYKKSKNETVWLIRKNYQTN